MREKYLNMAASCSGADSRDVDGAKKILSFEEKSK